MGLHAGFVTVQLPLAEDESVRQRGATTGNMHGATASIVEGGEVVQPAITIPGPAGDWAVDDRGPPETEEQGRKHSPTLKRTADHDHDRADAEEQLVETEDNLGEVDAAGRRSSGDILETKVRKISDEWACGARVCQRVSPEHPLEGNDLVRTIRSANLFLLRSFGVESA